MKSNNIVVYTAIFDGYDVLIDPDVVEQDVDYVCFTDDPRLKSDVWDIKVVRTDLNAALTNRKMKILPHKYLFDYEISIYIDGNIQIREPIKPLVIKYLSSSEFVAFSHPNRDNILDEAKACIDQNKAKKQEIEDQIELYQAAGFPDNLGLSENRILFRRHNQINVQNAMILWWHEVCEKAPRDQLSLMYVLWKYNDIKYNILENPVSDVSQFTIHPHSPTGVKKYLWPYWLNVRAKKDSNPAFAIIFYIGISLSILTNQGIREYLFTVYSFLQKRAD